MLRAGGLLDVLTSLSDCRHETVERIIWNGEFGGFVYVLDGFPQRDFVLWVFMCLTNISLLCLFCVYSVSILCPFFSLFRLPRRGLPRPIYTARAITPLPPLHDYHARLFPGYHVIVLCSIPGLSHLSYHAPPHT